MGRTGKKASKASAETERIRATLVAWYREHARDLPWRRRRDGYAIWVSEVMLQQTRVATVIPYFERWMQRFPTLRSLAEADDDDVLHAWQGLGYYSRARSLLRGARAVVAEHGGELPRGLDGLRALPGVGPYTAGAIHSIAYGGRAPAVDGNVSRVLCRLFALAGDPTRPPLASELWQRAAQLVPAEEPGRFNQALMELGATVCTPRAPLCLECPWRSLCAARRQRRENELPTPRARPAPTRVSMVAAVVERRGRVLLSKLPSDAPRWGGMWLFPSAEKQPRERLELALARALASAGGPRIDAHAPLFRIEHSVTRYRIELDVHRCEVSGSARDARSSWKRIAELSSLALPAAHRRIARLLADERSAPRRA